MTSGSDGDPAALRPVSLTRRIAEVVLIAAVFAAAGAWPVPDLNEPVYLTKARHAVDPAWAAGDFFLETPDAHGVFYLVFGPLAAALPLDQAAWIGRIAGWLAVAIGFGHLIVPLAQTSLGRLAAAALFSLALRCTTMAGEWVIGGCEAKVFAWACVLGGLGEFVRGRPAAAWLAMGCGAALHPIVGGWAMIVLLAVVLVRMALLRWAGFGDGNCLVARAAAAQSSSSSRRSPAPPGLRVEQPQLSSTFSRVVAAACVIGGCVAAGAGVWPAVGLSSGASAVEKAEGARMYVVERLSHHLLPRTFAEPLVARYALAIVVWWLLARQVPPTAARSRLDAFTAASLGVSLVGLVIAAVEPFAPGLAYGLLRFYWFRLADVMVPLALAVAAVAVLENAAACTRLLPVSASGARWLVAVLLCMDVAAQSFHWPLPGRTRLAARADSKLDAAAWVDVCAWVREHTPPDARFLTPRGAGSFTWRTDRAEVVSWKNSPQDARSLVEWRQRIVATFSPTGKLGDMGASVAAIGPEKIREVARRYGATHAIVPVGSAWQAELPFDRVYANAGYAVYALGDVTSPAARRASPPASPP
jgi:hypothetical protein